MPPPKLIYSALPAKFAICRFPPDAPIPDWASQPGYFSSITRTADELSVVCAEQNVPSNLNPSRGWLCLKLHGPFPFSETGILASFIDPLSSRGIPVFAIATFDTDYVLIEEKSWALAFEALRSAGHDRVAP